MATQRRLLPVALALCLFGCGPGEAQTEPAKGPPSPPSAKAPAPVESPTAPEPAPAPTQADAQASPPPADAPKPDAPKATVWRKVDLGMSSVEMPEPVKVDTSPNDSALPGAKIAFSNLPKVVFVAGDGPCTLEPKELVGAILREEIEHSLPMSVKENRIRAKDFEEQRVVMKHVNGMVTEARFWYWPPKGKKLGRVAWRAVTAWGLGPDTERAGSFLESLGPKPDGIAERGRGLIE